MISSSELSRLPDPPRLRRLMQSLAMVDAILSPEWDYRYYSFNSAWWHGEMMGSMRNGQGDEFFILFSEAGCFLKGFDHELADPRVGSEAFYSQLPEPFASQAQEPAFSPDDVTFCYWRRCSDTHWHSVRVPAYDDEDGSEWLLSLLDGDPLSYVEFARSYYERELDPALVVAVYEHRPMTAEIARSLNADCKWSDLQEDLAEIDYPHVADQS